MNKVSDPLFIDPDISVASTLEGRFYSIPLGQELCDEEIMVKGDSMLVINQMFGTWKIKSGLYTPLAKQARELLGRFTNIKGEWIQRDRNEVADGLSKDALKKALAIS